MITFSRPVEYSSGNNRSLVSKSSMYSRTLVVPLSLSSIAISQCSEYHASLCISLGCRTLEFDAEAGV